MSGILVAGDISQEILTFGRFSFSLVSEPGLDSHPRTGLHSPGSWVKGMQLLAS